MKSSLMDVSAKRSDSYKRFSRKAAEKLEFSGEMAVQLFKMIGAKIEDEPLLVNGKDRAWTIGNYLCMLRKSAKSIKLGVGSSGRIDISDEEVGHDIFAACNYKFSNAIQQKIKIL